MRRQWRILAEETNVNLRTDRFKFSSPGLFGAKPAQASKAALNPGSAGERALTSKVAGLRLKQGRPVCRWSSPAAAAGAIPASATPSACARTSSRGYVSLEAARDDYGVALDPDDFRSTAEATARLRRETAGS